MILLYGYTLAYRLELANNFQGLFTSVPVNTLGNFQC